MKVTVEMTPEEYDEFRDFQRNKKSLKLFSGGAVRIDDDTAKIHSLPQIQLPTFPIEIETVRPSLFDLFRRRDK